MKKLNLLSKTEMKKVKGGDPPKSAVCVDSITGSGICYFSIANCMAECYSGSCHSFYGGCSPS